MSIVQPAPGYRARKSALGRRGMLAAAAVVLIASAAAAQDFGDALTRRLTPEVLATVAPDADRIGPYEGRPLAAAAYKGDEIIAYIFSTLDIVAAPGYSSVPFDVIGGIDVNGELTAAAVIAHSEPYIKNDSVRQGKISEFLASHLGYRTRGSNPGRLPPDFVSGATVSARSMRAATLETARLVMRGRIESVEVLEPTLDVDGFRLAAWEDLLEDGTFARTTITNADLAQAFEKLGAIPNEPIGPADGRFVELYTALGTPPTVGRNVFGARSFKAYERRATLGGNFIIVGADGDYDLRGSAYQKFVNGYLFDRLALRQGEQTINFHREYYQWISTGSNYGIRSLDTALLFYLPPDSGFDPIAPWRLVLTVHGAVAGEQVAADFELPYTLPAQYVLMPEPEPAPAWVEAWQDSESDVVVLGGALGVLTLILAFQGPLTRRRDLHRCVRTGFLLFTLVWLGWIASAQLSIVNVFNYALAPFNSFGWGFYLAEPLIVMIAGYTALSLILLGRGVFCGWLCPFGALQELLSQVARVLKLPRWEPKESVQKMLWWGKYATAVIVIGLAFYSLDMATTASEIEPFKTAITAKFARAWPFVFYAAILLAIGLFTERFYCRYLCPLGGALAILGRFHVFDNLKRRPECGSPCHLCERSCAFKVIDTKGKINMNECFQCLDCQVEYHDDTRCPPLTWQRKRPTTATPAPDLPMAARGTVAGTPGTVAGTPGAVAGTPGAIAAT